MRASPEDAMSYATPIAEVIHSPSVDIGRPLRVVNDDYAAMIPESHGLNWEDDFFDDQDDVIAAFDLDYESMESYYRQLGWCFFGLTLLWKPLCFTALAALTPCCIHRNVSWLVRAQHVAITTNGIRFVRDHRRQCWGFSCTDAERTVKMIPFENISNCVVQEPSGNTCCLIVNILTTVKIDLQTNQFCIVGLRNPRAFLRLLWAMKHNHAVQVGALMGAPILQQTVYDAVISQTNDTAATTSTTGGDPIEVTNLLREIRDELREHNTLYQSIRNNQQMMDRNIATIDENAIEENTIEASDDRTSVSFPTVSTLTFN